MGHCGDGGGHKGVQEKRPVGTVVCRSDVPFTSEAKEELQLMFGNWKPAMKKRDLKMNKIKPR